MMMVDHRMCDVRYGNRKVRGKYNRELKRDKRIRAGGVDDMEARMIFCVNLRREALRHKERLY